MAKAPVLGQFLGIVIRCLGLFFVPSGLEMKLEGRAWSTACDVEEEEEHETSDY